MREGLEKGEKMTKKALTEVSPEILHLAEVCKSNNGIDPELYKVHEVKRGLRDLNGNGVVAGLTRISDIVSFRMEGDTKVPCEGVLRYRGIDIREICNGFLSEIWVCDKIKKLAERLLKVLGTRE